MASVLASAEQRRPFRLLWLIDSLTMGGAEALVLPFARETRSRGDELLVCCLKTIGGNPIESELAATGVRVFNLAAANLRDREAFRRLLALIRTEQIEIIHAHLTYASIWGAVASRITGVPCVATIHVAPRGRRSIRDKVRHLLMTVVLRWLAGAVIAVSESVRSAYGRGLGPKFSVIHNGIETRLFRRANAFDSFRLRRELEFGAETKIIMTIAVLREGKGLEVLLDAFRQVHQQRPDTRLVIVGDGPLRAVLARRVDASEVIRFTGYRRDVVPLLAGADLFVLPSLDDAFPTVLLEAMAAALPVIATRTGGIPEIVDHGNTGQLVQPGNAPELASAILALLDDPDARNRFGHNGYRRVETFFSTHTWVDRLNEVYRQLLSRRRR